MFCRYCGNDIAGDSVFCEVCGKRLKDEQVNQAPVMKEPIQYDTNSPLYYYNAQADTKPLEHGINREYHATKYEKMSGFSGSLPPIDSTPAPKIEYKRAPDEPIKPKKEKRGVVPYILLPVAVVIAGVMALLVGGLSETVIYGTLNLDIYISFIVEFGLRTITYFLVMSLFSLCCKGINKKVRFILSGYAGLMGHFLVRILLVIIGYIILYAVGYHDYDSFEIFYTANVISQYIGILPCAVISLLWFVASEKYQINRLIKSKNSKLVVPAVLMAIYMFAAFLINGALNVIFARGLTDLFGEWGDNFAWRVAWLIVYAISYGLLFVCALASKGSYKKLTFVGSALFSIALFEPFVMIMEGILYGWLYNDIFTGLLNNKILDNLLCISLYVPQYLLAIPVAIVIYILLNRYEVEKTNKKA